jgi:hypothetical protein
VIEVSTKGDLLRRSGTDAEASNERRFLESLRCTGLPTAYYVAKYSWGLSKAVLIALTLTCPLAACSTYHGPITNASEGYHEVGSPVGP